MENKIIKSLNKLALSVPLGMIWLYKNTISPWLLPCCRFTPTCSDYARHALQKHGFVKGSMLASWRILRCNPFCHSGNDPVPDSFSISFTCGQNHCTETKMVKP